MKNSIRNFDGIARMQILRKDFYLFYAYRGSQFGNRCLGDGWPAGAKMNYFSNSTNGLYQTQLGNQVKMSK